MFICASFGSKISGFQYVEIFVSMTACNINLWCKNIRKCCPCRIIFPHALISLLSFFQLGFDEAVLPTSMNIYETWHPGGIIKIKARDDKGKWKIVWSKDQPEHFTKSRIFSAEFKVQKKRIILLFLLFLLFVVCCLLLHVLLFLLLLFLFLLRIAWLWKCFLFVSP